MRKAICFLSSRVYYCKIATFLISLVGLTFARACWFWDIFPLLKIRVTHFSYLVTFQFQDGWGFRPMWSRRSGLDANISTKTTTSPSRSTSYSTAIIWTRFNTTTTSLCSRLRIASCSSITNVPCIKPIAFNVDFPFVPSSYCFRTPISVITSLCTRSITFESSSCQCQRNPALLQVSSISATNVLSKTNSSSISSSSNDKTLKHQSHSQKVEESTQGVSSHCSRSTRSRSSSQSSPVSWAIIAKQRIHSTIGHRNDS